MRSDSRPLFALLCFFWGTNWLATKIGVDAVPPITFAAARSLGMGVVMLLLAGPRAVGSLFAGAPVRCTLVGALTNTATYAGLYWGITRLSTGLTAIVNNALMPIGLLVFGLMLGEETISRRRVAGIALGVAGLSLLFARRTGDAVDAAALAAVALGTLAYCLGSVLARPLLRQASPLAVGGVQMLAGGVLLVPIAVLLEQPDAGALAGLLKPAVLASWAWLVFAGGAFAVWIYLRLIRDWGPTRAGMYAFVSPVIATALGAVVLGERLGPIEIAGALVMLAAAGLVLPTPRAAATSRS
jgi:drug/metabolite transporter (DMT)-like permease